LLAAKLNIVCYLPDNPMSFLDTFLKILIIFYT
jgi:hypothetical protein